MKLNLEQRLVPLLQSQMGDTLSSERKEVLKRAIGILFSFQRQRLVDAGAFVKVSACLSVPAGLIAVLFFSTVALNGLCIFYYTRIPDTGLSSQW